MAKKTRYKGIYKDDHGNYFFNLKIRQKDGTRKNICRSSKNAAKLFDLKCKLQSQGEKALEIVDEINNSSTLVECCDDFLENYKQKEKESSYYSTNIIVRKYIKEYFPNFYINQVVQVSILKKWKIEILNLNISTNRKNKIFSIMKRILNRAFLLSAITQEEYGKAVLTLDSIKENVLKSKKIDFWTVSEFNQFINVIPTESKWYTFFYTLFYTGMRIGEILGVTIDDFNYQKRTLTINKQYSLTNNITTPKSKNSERIILLTQENANLINNWINKNEIKSFIFPFSRTHINRIKNLYCKNAEVKTIRIHDFRHSHVSLLINKYLENNLAIDFLTIAKRMGHSVQETMDTYAHMYPSSQKNIVDLL